MMRISIIVPQGAFATDLITAVAPRELHHVHEFASAVARAIHADVPVIEGTLADAPTAGYLLVFELEINTDPQLGPRIVAVSQDRSSIMKSVESSELAGAIEKQRYFEWCTRRQQERGSGLIGRKDVAARVPARTLTGPYTSARYAALASDATPDLISLLLAYLEAHSQVVQHD